MNNQKYKYIYLFFPDDGDNNEILNSGSAEMIETYDEFPTHFPGNRAQAGLQEHGWEMNGRLPGFRSIRSQVPMDVLGKRVCPGLQEHTWENTAPPP